MMNIINLVELNLINNCHRYGQNWIDNKNNPILIYTKKKNKKLMKNQKKKLMTIWKCIKMK